MNIKKHWKKTLLSLFLTTLLISSIALVFDCFSGIISYYVQIGLIYFINIILFLIVFYFYQDECEKKVKDFSYYSQLEFIAKYIFLAILFLIAINQLFADFEWSKNFYNIYLSWINNIKSYLTVLAILTGGFTFWVNRKNVEVDLKKEQKEEVLEEKKRAKIFDKKYGKWKPKKLKFNSFKNIIFSIFYLPFFVVSFLLFTFARWVHKEGYRYSLGLIILSFSGLLLRIYNIKLQKLWIDELISLSAINNIINSGIPSLPSGVMYTRNIFFHYLLAFIKILFNTEDIKLKIISVIAGFLTIIFVYIFTKKILNKKVAIISSLLITFFNFEIAWSRQIRAYMLLQFAIILCVFVYSRLKKNVSLKNLLLFLFSAIFTVSVSLIGIIIVCILILDFFIEKKNRTKLLHLIKKNTKLFILIFFIFSLFMYAGNIFSAIIFISHSILNPINNTHNYIKLFNSFFPYLYVLMPFLLLTLIFSFNKFIKTIYFYIILILSLTFFIIEASWLRYLTCALPFLIIISSFFIHILYIIYCQKKNKFINILFFIFFLTPFFISDLSLFPQNNYQIQEPQTNFKLSYEYIYKNIKSSDTVISITTGNIPAHYYLKEKFILNKNYIFTLLLDKQKKAYRSYKKNGIWKENYVGTTIITNEMELKKIIKYNSGYLVFDQQKLYHIDNSIKNLLTTMNFLEEYSDETIRLYYWDSESHSFSL